MAVMTCSHRTAKLSHSQKIAKSVIAGALSMPPDLYGRGDLNGKSR